MTGLSAADIQGLSVSDSRARRRRLRVNPGSTGRRLQADQAVDVTYMVGANSVYTAEQLQNELNSALTSGTFTSNLNTNAENAGATDMSGTSSNAITAPSPGSSGLSSGAVAGIIIGCAVVVIILLFMIIYCCCCYGKGEWKTSSLTPNVSLGVSLTVFVCVCMSPHLTHGTQFNPMHACHFCCRP